MSITSLISRPPSPAGKARGCSVGKRLFVFAGEGAREFGIRAVAGFDRDDVAADAMREKREVADNIEDFVADELVGKTERLLAQDGFAADHDGVFQAAPLIRFFSINGWTSS